MAKIAEAFVEISARMGKLKTGMARALSMTRSDTAKIGRAFQAGFGFALEAAKSAVRTITRLVTNMASTIIRWAKRIGIALAAAFGLAIAAGVTFDKRMSRVQAITGATASDFDKLRKAAKELGRSTVFSASQAAEAMGVLAVGGFSVNEILKAMPSLLNLAAAGQLEMAAAADITIKIMRGMGIAAEDVEGAMDVMAKAFTSANTDLQMLSEAMKFVGPVAKASGKELEEIVATLQVLANAGIQAGMAGTTVRNILIRLSGGASDATKELKKLGINAADDTGRLKHLADIVDEVKRAFSGMTEVERQASAARIAGLRGIAGFTELIGLGGDAVRDYEKSLKGAGGTAKRLADIQIDNLGGALTILKSALEGLGIAVSDVFKGDIRSGVEFATRMITDLADVFDQDGMAIKAKFFDVLKAGFNEVKELIALTGISVKGLFASFTDGASDFDSVGKRIQAVLVNVAAEIDKLSVNLGAMVAKIGDAVAEAVALLKDTATEFWKAFTGEGQGQMVKPMTLDDFLYDEAPDTLGGKRRRGGDLSPGKTPKDLERDRRNRERMERELKHQRALGEIEAKRLKALEALKNAPLFGVPDFLNPDLGKGFRVAPDDPRKAGQAGGDASVAVASEIAQALITTVQTALGGFKIGQKNRQEDLAERSLREDEKTNRILGEISEKVGVGGLR